MSLELIQVYPADLDTGIPTGIEIVLSFSSGVDLQTLKDNVVLYGPDQDKMGGPYTAMWIDKRDQSNKFLLKSPGFTGIVPLVITKTEYFDTDTGLAVEALFENRTEEIDSELGMRVFLKPDPEYNTLLAPNTNFTLHIAGDVEENNVIGVGRRSVYEIDTIVGDGNLYVSGPYLGPGFDTLHVKITKAGEVGEAKYKFWYQSEGEGSATLGKITSSRFRIARDNLKVRFSNGPFAVGDEWAVFVSNPTRMEQNYKVKFTTGDGSYTTAPSSPSTPASSTLPSSVMPGYGESLFVLEMLPPHTSYNNNIDKRIITIEFSEDLDPTTLEGIKLWSYSASGHYDSTRAPVELQKTMTVSGNVLTIRY